VLREKAKKNGEKQSDYSDPAESLREKKPVQPAAMAGE